MSNTLFKNISTRSVLIILIRCLSTAQDFFGYLFKPLTIGVKALILDKQNRVLLVTHTYRNGWDLPGGRISRGESAQEAIAREINEEVDIIVGLEDLILLNVYYVRTSLKNEHVILFLVTNWRQPAIIKSNLEISCTEFFSLSDLPNDTVASTREQLKIFL